MKKRIRDKLEKIAMAEAIKNHVKPPSISAEEAGLTDEYLDDLEQEVEEHEAYMKAHTDQIRYHYTIRSWMEDLMSDRNEPHPMCVLINGRKLSKNEMSIVAKRRQKLGWYMKHWWVNDEQ